MKKILLLIAILPCGLIAQDRLTDGIYSSPDIRKINSSTSQNQTPVLTGSGSFDIKIATVSGHEFPQQAALNVYPNPAVSDAKVLFTSEENGTAYTIQMISQEGRPLLQKKGISVKGNNVVPLNMSSYPTGTYYLQLFTGNRKETARFVKLVR